MEYKAWLHKIGYLGMDELACCLNMILGDFGGVIQAVMSWCDKSLLFMKLYNLLF